MWVKSLVIVCAIGIISTLSALDITGFRDMKWGDSPKALGPQAVEVVKLRDPIKKITRYTRKNEKLMIGDIQLTSIRYSFFDNKLYQIFIETQKTGDKRSNSNTASLLSGIFTDKYGPYGYSDADSYMWNNKGNAHLYIWSNLNLAELDGPAVELVNTEIREESEDYLKQKRKNDL